MTDSRHWLPISCKWGHPGGLLSTWMMCVVPSLRLFAFLPRFQLLSEDIFHEAAYDAAGLLLHIRCDMGVGVQREGGIGVAQDTGQGFGVHTAGEGVGGEGVTQIVEANAGQPCPLEERFHVAIGCIGRFGKRIRLSYMLRISGGTRYDERTDD